MDEKADLSGVGESRPPVIPTRSEADLTEESASRIVDDNPSVRKLVLVLFTSNGFSICGEAENGAQAIEKARQTRPDIVVLDYSMPVMDCIRAAKSLKQLMPRVPLLLFTVHDSWVLEKEALAAGVAAIVSKEKASDLVIKVRTLLSARNRLKRMFSLRIWW